jgi:hypothetical protein
MLQTAQPWLQQHLQLRSSGMSSIGEVKCLCKVALAFDWMREQLGDLQEFPDVAAAAKVPPGLLQELKTLADPWPRFEALGNICAAASQPGFVSPAAEAAVFQAHLQGCAEGWLPEGLQQLGAKVWAAWPQKYACNDDLCQDRSGLTEQSCGKLKCSGCKVGGPPIASVTGIGLWATCFLRATASDPARMFCASINSAGNLGLCWPGILNVEVKAHSGSCWKPQSVKCCSSSSRYQQPHDATTTTSSRALAT